MNKKNIIIIFILINIILTNQKMIIPMDESQSNHLKAYGIAYSYLKNGYKVEWLLNYRGGSFLLDISEKESGRVMTVWVPYLVDHPNRLTKLSKRYILKRNPKR